ncbi:U3 small nucleolar RNA-associated protein 10 [Marchantia polymorpha subsp. ruderalis]|uniref:BP28 C-terminal domain-containing protein n=2 Tax=Marchantia polymorpha TaxID=3197 RepID=A0AAF6AM24_MARPO|nr:hypothetical protein MARPO_0043s0008 [Marchantia polymorpha]BBM97494.1 hypothetical protein Mp_1g06160 [Marchantia polymorpha subsp. ruderalis]|eukprot:PTQ39733.1 hypothetical protein MARPO_0043s0008 [Marchantia polymorpha]
MTSHLAAQLQALAVANGASTKAKQSTRPSLLYHPSKAADIDVRTIFDAAEAGLEELVLMDGRFKIYRHSLFNPNKIYEDRELQTKEENEKLDTLISAYLRLLAGYVLLTPAHSTLEYLIRRYKIEVYNAEDVVLCVLPCHETTLFVRIIQLLHLKKTRWHFLDALKETGGPPPRQWLVKKCTSDLSVLEAICDSAMSVSALAVKAKTIISFTFVVIIETLAEVRTVTSEIVNRIQPLILHSLDKKLDEDYRVGALMVVGALANRTTLSQSFVDALFDLIARAFVRGLKRDGASLLQLQIMVLIQLVQTQELVAFPLKAFKTLVKTRDFLSMLTDLAKVFHAQKFLKLYVQALLDHCLINEHYEMALVHAINLLPLTHQAETMVVKLLDLGFGSEGDADSSKLRNFVKRLIQAVETRYPVELDKGVSTFFRNSKLSTKDKKDSPLFDFLTQIFRGSLRSPLKESNMSLYLSIDHPQAQIRELALKKLSELAAASSPDEQGEMNTVLREAYMRRLSDDNYNILRAVISADDLVKLVPSERLLHSLSSILGTCSMKISEGSDSSTSDVKSIAKKTVHLLATRFLEQHPSYVEAVGLVFMDHLLQNPKTRRLNKYVLEAAGTLNFSFFKNLSKVLEQTPFQNEKENMKAKEKVEKQKEWIATVNQKIVKCLAVRVSKEPNTFAPFLLRSNMSDDSKVLAVLVLLQCFHKHTKDITPSFVETSLRWLRDEWTSVGSRISSPVPELQKIDYSAWQDVFYVPESSSTYVYMELLLRALHSLVVCVPITTDVNLEKDGGIGQDTRNELFVFFAGFSSVKIFIPHIELLLSCLPAPDTFTFLSKFFISEGSAVPAFVQVHSLDVLASQLLNCSSKLKGSDGISVNHLEGILPSLLVALSSPLKAVRTSAIRCLENLLITWDKLGQRGKKGLKKAQSAFLDPATFGNVIRALVAARETFIGSGTSLGQFLSEKFGPSQGSAMEMDTKGNGDASHQSVVCFLVDHTFRLPVHAQRVIFSALQGIALGSELVSATHERFKQLVECRKLCHLQNPSEGTFEKLTQGEVQLLEVLVQMYTPEVILDDDKFIPAFLETLLIEGGSLLDAAVVQPCFAALKCLKPNFYAALSSPSQDLVFQSLINLSTIDNEVLRSEAHSVLRAIKIDATTVARHVGYLLKEEPKPTVVARKKKRSKVVESSPSQCENWPLKGRLQSSTSSILELLLWKSDMHGRQVLVSPLCKLLRSIISGVWPVSSNEEDASMEEAAAKKERDSAQAGTVINIHHLLLMILDFIARDLVSKEENSKDTTNQTGFDVDAVVVSVNKATDAATRNYALALLTSLGKLIPQEVLKHVIDILGVVGESSVTQDDSHSHEVVSQMLTAVVPVWLAVEKDPTALLQVFVNALPRVPPHRRMTLVTNLLRVTAVEESLHIFVYLLLRQATVHDSLQMEFGATLCRHYSLDARLPAMVKLLSMVKVDNRMASSEKSSVKKSWSIQQSATKFVANQLRSSEGHADADISEVLQSSYVALMELVLLQLQTLGKSASISSALKKDCQDTACFLLDNLTHLMASSEYIKGISFLLTHSDSSIRRKALRMYATKLKEQEVPKRMRQSRQKQASGKVTNEDSFTKEELDIRVQIVKDITDLLSGPKEEQSVSAKIAAIDALDISALKFGGRVPEIFTTALSALIKNFQSLNRTLIAAALRCVSTILAQLGPQALPVLPDTVMGLFDVADKTLGQPQKPLSTADDHEDLVSSGSEQSDLLLAILLSIETLLDKLGSFLTPYLSKIVGLVVLQPSLVTGSVVEISKKAEDVRLLIPTKLPARLLLDPLMSVYNKAVEAGEDSTCALFDMLGAMTSKLDRSSVAAYHAKIFNFCLAAFDLRRNSIHFLPNISRVENSVVSAIVSLVMKLSETSFKPLFVKVLEWAESEESTGVSVAGKSVDRNIVFYKLVNQLAEKLRSVFVPYFQYLLNGCVQYLMSGTIPQKPKKKKKKQVEELSASSSEWHLRQLVLSSLHKCFLYDTVGFLDTARFEQLLEPVVTQIGVDPPTALSTTKHVPTVSEMDDTIVSCLGQMALTAGSDLLWKPLNHEVLMKTRMIHERCRLLGLRVVKFLAEHLKEEYLVLLPETIPFLAELLEDEELTVVAKTQEVVKLLEDLSGEDLAQYF